MLVAWPLHSQSVVYVLLSCDNTSLFKLILQLTIEQVDWIISQSNAASMNLRVFCHFLCMILFLCVLLFFRYDIYSECIVIRGKYIVFSLLYWVLLLYKCVCLYALVAVPSTRLLCHSASTTTGQESASSTRSLRLDLCRAALTQLRHPAQVVMPAQVLTTLGSNAGMTTI